MQILFLSKSITLSFFFEIMIPLDLNAFMRRWCILGYIVTKLLSAFIRQTIIHQQTFYYSCNEKIYTTFKSQWFNVVNMSVAMMLATPFALLNGGTNVFKKLFQLPMKFLLLIFVCSFCDITQCFTNGRMLVIGGLSFSSLIEILTIICMIFFRRIFLKKHMYGYMWISVGLCFLAIISLTLSQLMSSSSSSLKPMVLFVNIFLSLFSVLLIATQYIIQEYVIHNSDIEPEILVGCIGLGDFVIMMFMIYPFVYFVKDNEYFTIHESFCQVFEMFIHSKTIIFSYFIYICIIIILNMSFVKLILYTNSIYAVMYDMLGEGCKNLIEIIKDLTPGFPFRVEKTKKALTYSITFNSLSMILIISALMFLTELIKIPGFEYPEPEKFLIPNNRYLPQTDLSEKENAQFV